VPDDIGSHRSNSMDRARLGRAFGVLLDAGWQLKLARAPSSQIRLALVCQQRRSYTFGMKTAVSIPDDVFRKTAALARRAGVSRSQVVSAALREYVARHTPDEVTDAMDRAIAALGKDDEEFTRVAARRLLKRSRW
jgi:predicted transcriptional regulator